MLLFVESICGAASPAWSRLAATHLLGGAALALIGGRTWFALVVAALEFVALVVGAFEWAHLALYAAAGVLLGVAIRSVIGAQGVAFWWRVPFVLALAVVASWRVDDVLCSSAFPLGLVRSFVVYVGGVLLMLYWWAPTPASVPASGRSGAADRAVAQHVAVHATHFATALSVFASYAWLFAPLPVEATLACALALCSAAFLRTALK